jgi:hypothetical protein
MAFVEDIFLKVFIFSTPSSSPFPIPIFLHPYSAIEEFKSWKSLILPPL